MTSFQLKRSTIQHDKIKSNYVFMNAENWASFTLETRYLVDIISTSCPYHGVHYV